MSHVSAHVLDARLGLPAVGVAVSLVDETDGLVAEALTDADGRASSLGPDRLDAGTYTVRFASGDYFAAHDVACLHPHVPVVFSVGADEAHLHIPLLLSPYSYTTYRGS